MAEHDTSRDFARVKMDGDRFTGGRLPVSTLSELENYRDLVIAAARIAWFKGNPNKPLPEDFNSSFELSLVDVEDGSATSVLERPVSSKYDSYFDRGREAVGLGIEDVVNGSGAEISAELLELEAFANLGSTLGPGEDLQLPVRGSIPSVTITQESHVRKIRPAHHRQLELHADDQRVNPPEPGYGWLIGRLIALNANTSNFEVQSEKYGLVKGRYQDPDMLDDFRAVLGSSEQAPVVRLYIRGSYRDGKIVRLNDVEKFQALEVDGEPWSRRFIELASLEEGWSEDDPDSQPISFAALNGARELLREVARLGKPRPGIFPLVDGGVSVEWATPNVVYSIDVTPEAEFSLFHLDENNFPTESDVINIVEAKQFVERVKIS